MSGGGTPRDCELVDKKDVFRYHSTDFGGVALR
jgi:hypothetical protein